MKSSVQKFPFELFTFTVTKVWLVVKKLKKQKNYEICIHTYICIKYFMTHFRFTQMLLL